MFSTCQSQSMFSTYRFRRPAGSLAQVSLLCRPSTPTLNVLPLCDNLLFSCIRAHPSEPSVSSPKSAGFSHPGTFAMISSRRTIASCPHKTWVWRCLTLATPRREAIAFDAVASTRTRGLTTLATSAASATAPRALEALLVNA